MSIDRSAVIQATAITALGAIVTGLVTVGIDELKALLSERREKRKEQSK